MKLIFVQLYCGHPLGRSAYIIIIAGLMGPKVSMSCVRIAIPFFTTATVSLPPRVTTVYVYYRLNIRPMILARVRGLTYSRVLSWGEIYVTLITLQASRVPVLT